MDDRRHFFKIVLAFTIRSKYEETLKKYTT